MGEHRVVSVCVVVNIDRQAEVQHYPREITNVH